MTISLLLNEDTIRNFVGPETDSDLLQNLLKAQIKKRLLQLASTQRRLDREAPELVEKTGFSQAYLFLKQLPPALLSRIISYPSFGEWCEVANALLVRQAHINLPDGQISSHLGLLGNFALAGALEQEWDFELALWLDDRAYLPLPTLHCTIIAPLNFAGTRVQCRAKPGHRLIISQNSLHEQCIRIDDSSDDLTAIGSVFNIRHAPLLANRFELNDYDPLLEHNIGFQREQRFERVDKSSLQRWRTSTQAAWDLLQVVHPAYSSEVDQYVSVIVPLLSQSANVHVSCSFPETYGMVQMSWSERVSQLAEALVHEYHHNKLNTLFDLDPLIIDTSGAAVYYSPWRDDSRPLQGLLHGIFAFQSVTHFWLAYLNRSLPEHQWAEHEYVRRRAQTLTAVEALLDQAELTEVGEVVVSEIKRQLLAMPQLSISLSAQRQVQDELASHRLRWQLRYRNAEQKEQAILDSLWRAAGGIHKEPNTYLALEKFEALNEQLELICNECGISGGIELNRLEDAQVRRDPILDFLSRESVRNPQRFEQIAEQISKAGSSDAPLQQLLEGHVVYIRGEYIVAANRYASCISAAPDNIDTWRDFVFALRHLGLIQEANSFLFHPQIVITAAKRYVVDIQVFRCLLDSEAELPSTFTSIDPASGYILLLRWLKKVIHA